MKITHEWFGIDILVHLFMIKGRLKIMRPAMGRFAYHLFFSPEKGEVPFAAFIEAN